MRSLTETELDAAARAACRKKRFHGKNYTESYVTGFIEGYSARGTIDFESGYDEGVADKRERSSKDTP